MTVTAQQSNQVANGLALPAVKNEVVDLAKLRIARIDFKQNGAGDIASTIDLVQFGGAHYRIIPALSWLSWSAWGTSATIDVGHTGYTKLDGTVVAAVDDAIEDTLAVATAGSAFLGVGTNAAANIGALEIETKGNLLLRAVVGGAVIPDQATLTGWIAYVTD
ncbi:hypothetical protein LGH82_00010 [Mesorhizobium sp. PAMC28654]|uniref:hypothetical protein n=1 Tax=Mesorhizobium sp. PAMC28654 TaxID=2880934 RepID=UPI001D0AD00C|nr:hypothetical protein [Mesorhizobium sp. PAMC28654]UDL89841.1 hypothetical protein LGH82_00010 [Mesorhizobium sp. PAMC28654]